MITLSVNGRNDIYIATSGKLAIAAEIDAVKLSCEQAMRAILGEMMFAANQGIPIFETVFNQTNLPQFEAAARATLARVPHVVLVESFSALITDDTLNYSARIKTDFGIVELNKNV